MKIVYYLILAIIVISMMLLTSTIIGSLFGFDSIGTKGFIAGIGLGVIFARSRLFKVLDRVFKNKKR